MGVTIFVDGGLYKISMPYSSLQQLRIILLKATITYLQQIAEHDGSEEECENLLEELTKCIQGETHNESINYKEFETLDLLFLRNDLIGVFKFVNHSDADGYHSSGDAHDILKSFEKLYIGSFNKEKGEKDIREKYLDTLCDIFAESFSNEKYVEYC